MIIETAYRELQNRANNQMKNGEIAGYLRTLIQLQQMRKELSLVRTSRV